MKKIDIAKLRREIHLYAGFLGMHGAKADPAEVEQLRVAGKAFPWGFPVKRFYYSHCGEPQKLRESRVSAYIRFTQLVALRAHLRGRLHFSPRTNLAEAQHIFGLPVATKFADGVYDYQPITMEIQGQWVEALMPEFEIPEVAVVEQKVAG